MNILIIESIDRKIKNNENTMHTRNALWLSKILNADLIGLPSELSKLNKEYEIIIVSYSSFYIKFRAFGDFILKQPKAQLFYIINEYGISGSQLLEYVYKNSKRKYDCLANHSKQSNKMGKRINICDKWHIINWNVLSFKEKYILKKINKFLNIPKKNIIYYGMFRKDRLKYFKKYFDNNFIVSASLVSQSRYKEKNITAKFIKNIKWDNSTNSLNGYFASLYIEDEYTHNNFNFLANRFYEALTYNILIFFDKSCQNTVEKSGYPIDNFWIVDSKKELFDKIKYCKDKNINKMPNKIYDFAEQEKKDVIKNIKQIIGE